MDILKYFALLVGIAGFTLLLGNHSAHADQDEIPPPTGDWESLIAKPTAIPTPYIYRVPSKLSDGWKVGDLRKQKADLGKLSKGVNRILSAAIPDMHSLVVLRHGKILLEEYFNGCTANYPNPIYSCTKSVFSTVYGIAQDQGLLNLDQKIYDLYPEYRSKAGWDKRKDAITVGMLLCMTTGLDCSDVGTPNCGAVMGQAKDWIAYPFSLPLLHAPGTTWMYNGCCLSLLSNLIAQKSGMSFPDYAKKALLDPLNIPGDTWVTGPNDVNRVDFGLAWKARDMAKLGQLYLNQGMWEGKQIVSASWVKDATTVHAPPGGAFGHDYGYLWHIKRMKWNGKPGSIFYANGYQGQAIFVSPDADLVCVMTANSGSDLIYSMEDGLFEENILNSF